jgi:hypothetical protein
VAQTKRRRQTKHRGNAAGVVEARGRTGRKPTAAEKGSTGARASASKEQRRQERYDRPPTWRGAFYRALIAAVVLLFLAIFLLHSAKSAIIYFAFALLVYTPISYYTDMWMYRRRQRNKARASG